MRSRGELFTESSASRAAAFSETGVSARFSSDARFGWIWALSFFSGSAVRGPNERPIPIPASNAPNPTTTTRRRDFMFGLTPLMLTGSNYLDPAFWQRIHEGTAIGLGHDPVIQNHDDPAVALGSDQTTHPLAQFQHGLGQRVFRES